MATTQDRLNAYYEAEARILQAQSVRGPGTERRNAELAEVRKAISDLQQQLGAENRRAAGQIGPITMVAGFNPEFSGRGGCE